MEKISAVYKIVNTVTKAASLVFATDGFANDQIKATITVLSTGYVYGYWDYGN